MSSYEDLRHAFVDVQQSVAYLRRALTHQLQEVVLKSTATREPVSSELLDILVEFWRYDPAGTNYEFGQYVYFLLSDQPGSLADYFMGYEWNGDTVAPELSFIIKQAVSA